MDLNLAEEVRGLRAELAALTARVARLEGEPPAVRRGGRPATATLAVAAALERHAGGALKVSQVAAVAGVKVRSAAFALSRLARDGKVERAGGGWRWRREVEPLAPELVRERLQALPVDGIWRTAAELRELVGGAVGPELPGLVAAGAFEHEGFQRWRRAAAALPGTLDL